ncbi:MAG: acetamidase/formamidase family protein [Solirubrobacterales bacterium]
MIELRDRHHYRWDRSLTPAALVEPGETVRVWCREACDGQFTPDALDDQMRHVDQARVHSLSGPIAVAGAEPGDALVVDILEIEHEGWAWTSMEPGFGVLHEEFGDDEYHVQIWRVDERGRAVMKPGVAVGLDPFFGVIGVAPAEPGEHSTIPPRDVGGNMDCRRLRVGSRAFFPVKVAGGLLSLGDGHLAQGDGEVCGTALEAPLVATLRIGLERGLGIERVMIDSPPPPDEGSGAYVTTSTNGEMRDQVREAVGDMVSLLVDRHDLERHEAYMLCSAAGNLAISVAPLGPGHDGMVSFALPKSVFDEEVGL